MKKNVIKLTILMVAATALIALFAGCESKQVATTGFLTDYSRLETGKWDDWGYMDESRLARYSGFIIEPVKVQFQKTTSDFQQGGMSQPGDMSQQGDMSQPDIQQQNISELTSYMHNQLAKAVREAGKNVVYREGPYVARIRVAITDMRTGMMEKEDDEWGKNDATIEAEILDSMNGEQVAATVESEEGLRVPMTSMEDWSSTREAIDDWADDFRKELEDLD